MEAQNSNKNILTHAHDEDYRFRIWSKLETFKNAVDEQVTTHKTHTHTHTLPCPPLWTHTLPCPPRWTHTLPAHRG